MVLWPLISFVAACGGPDVEFTELMPDLAVAPSAVEFGDVVVAFDSTETLALINAGLAPLIINAVSISDNEDGAFTLTTESGETTDLEIARDESATFTLNFKPGTYAEYSRKLIIESNDPEHPTLSVDLTGEGVDGPVPDIEIDPLALDFGELAIGGSLTLWATITNVGDGPLVIESSTQSGSGAFTVMTDPAGQTLADTGDYHTMLVTYAPTQDSGDSGKLQLTTNDPDEPNLEILFLGNGGGDFEYPEAIIDCPDTVDPPVNVDLDGSGSTDPSGYTPLTHSWSLTATPDGSGAELDTATGAWTSLFADLAGDYEVQLKVTNSQGVESAPAKCNFTAEPDEKIHVELIWSTGDSDMDMHLVQEGSQFNQKPGDCCWCNPNPSWGSSGGGDDPILALDNRIGYGPENINLEAPANGDYHVKVHYYEDAGGGASLATVRVWIDGVQIDEASKNLTHNQVWDVGYVRWPEGVFAQASTDNYAAPSKQCWQD
jgi:hypothetical protein